MQWDISLKVPRGEPKWKNMIRQTLKEKEKVRVELVQEGKIKDCRQTFLVERKICVLGGYITH